MQEEGGGRGWGGGGGRGGPSWRDLEAMEREAEQEVPFAARFRVNVVHTRQSGRELRIGSCLSANDRLKLPYRWGLEAHASRHRTLENHRP